MDMEGHNIMMTFLLSYACSFYFMNAVVVQMLKPNNSLTLLKSKGFDFD